MWQDEVPAGCQRPGGVSPASRERNTAGGGGSEWSPGWNLLEEAVVSGVTEKRDNFILRNCSKERGFLLTGLIVLDSAH